ncbi:MAG: DUF2283 domain-containing protein [ANME-2 cluster archaeon]|nr:DUF2283 domain-containing protein [ANME-2 cluster archaeon]
MASVEYDSEINAMYIRITEGKVDKSEPIADNIIVDVDKNGKAVGIEILLPKQDVKLQDFVLKALKAEA